MRPQVRTLSLGPARRGSRKVPSFCCLEGGGTCGLMPYNHGREAVTTARSGAVAAGSNPVTRTNGKGDPTRGSLAVLQRQGSNHVRTCRGHVHETVRTLSNTMISFSRPPQAEKKCKRTLSLGPTSEIIPHGKKTAIALAVAVFPSVLHVSSFPNRTRFAGLRFG